MTNANNASSRPWRSTSTNRGPDPARYRYDPYVPVPYTVIHDYRCFPDDFDRLIELEDIVRRTVDELGRVFPHVDFHIYTERAPTCNSTLTLYAPPGISNFLDHLLLRTLEDGVPTKDEDIALAVAERMTQQDNSLCSFALRRRLTPEEISALPTYIQILERFFPDHNWRQTHNWNASFQPRGSSSFS